ncbi:unnamed protein product [Microthlaspi erraticum]|uniref:Uncharacterized protein n=1 Tax=Microthlaspi erraticum TaxID=1685480 RepID=A0A6D2JF16_9BRAS|nr:unnamed protein product [Microthlaspi erraticum]
MGSMGAPSSSALSSSSGSSKRKRGGGQEDEPSLLHLENLPMIQFHQPKSLRICLRGNTRLQGCRRALLPITYKGGKAHFAPNQQSARLAALFILP